MGDARDRELARHARPRHEHAGRRVLRAQLRHGAARRVGRVRRARARGRLLRRVAAARLRQPRRLPARSRGRDQRRPAAALGRAHLVARDRARLQPHAGALPAPQLRRAHGGPLRHARTAPRGPTGPHAAQQPTRPPWSPVPCSPAPLGRGPAASSSPSSPRAHPPPPRRARSLRAAGLRAPREGSAQGELERRAREASPRSVGVAARLLRQHTLAPGPMPPTPPPSAAQGWWTGTS